MRFYSLNKRASSTSAKEAVIRGLAPDGGLYMPESIPRLPEGFLTSLCSEPSSEETFKEIAVETAKLYFSSEVEAEELRQIAEKTASIPAPLSRLSQERFVLELFHGPTMAFKDFGACFMAELMSYFRRGSSKELVILTATSGDTGGAVGRGFLGVPGIKVFILYPSGRVSPLQEKQLTTLGQNVEALEIDGTFDDCQRLVKAAFSDSQITEKLDISSANSINISRLIPQTFYYLFASYCLAETLGKKNSRVLYSVPSGNLGNLTAGLIAKKMAGLNCRFIAATNANNVLTEYLETGLYRARASTCTLSNAMDVGAPSNFPRLLAVCDSDLKLLRQDLSSQSYSDEQTLQAIKHVRSEYNYLLDPHGAVAFLGMEDEFSKGQYDAACCLETAHPAKFLEVIAQATSLLPDIPERLAEALSKPKRSIRLASESRVLKDFLLS